MLNHPFIIGLQEQLKNPLPGFDAQYEMAHVNREKIKSGEFNLAGYRSSAVLILLVKREDGFYIPLTERHTYNGAHSGQISLPGGKMEESDSNLVQTAIRECYEEIGLHSTISIIGELTPVYIPVSKFVVSPFIGVFTGKEINYTINQGEVKSLLELNVEDLKSPEIIKQTTVEPTPGYKLKTPYFDVQGKIVWGATAMILNEFKKLL